MTRADFIAAGDQFGWIALISAAIPETCGTDIDVPELSVNDFLIAPKIFTPGATTSGCNPYVDN